LEVISHFRPVWEKIGGRFPQLRKKVTSYFESALLQKRREELQNTLGFVTDFARFFLLIYFGSKHRGMGTRMEKRGERDGDGDIRR
jgi:hypothetical protein